MVHHGPWKLTTPAIQGLTDGPAFIPTTPQLLFSAYMATIPLSRRQVI